MKISDSGTRCFSEIGERDLKEMRDTKKGGMVKYWPITSQNFKG